MATTYRATTNSVLKTDTTIYGVVDKAVDKSKISGIISSNSEYRAFCNSPGSNRSSAEYLLLQFAFDYGRIRSLAGKKKLK